MCKSLMMKASIGSRGGGGGDSDDGMQYCNLHCVMVMVGVFFLKQWHIYRMDALQLVLWWWWCLNVHGIVAVWCGGGHMW